MAKYQQVLQVRALKDGVEQILFFGAVNSIYDHWSVDELNIAYKSLLNYFTKAEADEVKRWREKENCPNDIEDMVKTFTYTYTNKKCTITKGVLITKPKKNNSKTIED